jgi:hypothetical protein
LPKPQLLAFASEEVAEKVSKSIQEKRKTSDEVSSVISAPVPSAPSATQIPNSGSSNPDLLPSGTSAQEFKPVPTKDASTSPFHGLQEVQQDRTGTSNTSDLGDSPGVLKPTPQPHPQLLSFESKEVVERTSEPIKKSSENIPETVPDIVDKPSTSPSSEDLDTLRDLTSYMKDVKGSFRRLEEDRFHPGGRRMEPREVLKDHLREIRRFQSIGETLLPRIESISGWDADVEDKVLEFERLRSHLHRRKSRIKSFLSKHQVSGSLSRCSSSSTSIHKDSETDNRSSESQPSTQTAVPCTTERQLAVTPSSSSAIVPESWTPSSLNHPSVSISTTSDLSTATTTVPTVTTASEPTLEHPAATSTSVLGSWTTQTNLIEKSSPVVSSSRTQAAPISTEDQKSACSMTAPLIIQDSTDSPHPGKERTSLEPEFEDLHNSSKSSYPSEDKPSDRCISPEIQLGELETQGNPQDHPTLGSQVVVTQTSSASAEDIQTVDSLDQSGSLENTSEEGSSSHQESSAIPELPSESSSNSSITEAVQIPTEESISPVSPQDASDGSQPGNESPIELSSSPQEDIENPPIQQPALSVQQLADLLKNLSLTDPQAFSVLRGLLDLDEKIPAESVEDLPESTVADQGDKNTEPPSEEDPRSQGSETASEILPRILANDDFIESPTENPLEDCSRNTSVNTPVENSMGLTPLDAQKDFDLHPQLEKKVDPQEFASLLQFMNQSSETQTDTALIVQLRKEMNSFSRRFKSKIKKLQSLQQTPQTPTKKANIKKPVPQSNVMKKTPDKLAGKRLRCEPNTPASVSDHDLFSTPSPTQAQHRRHPKFVPVWDPNEEPRSFSNPTLDTRRGTRSASKKFPGATTVSGSRWPISCSHCPGKNVRTCPQFLTMSLVERYETVRAKGLCYHCLSRGHKFKDCHFKQDQLCGIEGCRSRHHHLLHRPHQASTLPTIQEFMASFERVSSPTRFNSRFNFEPKTHLRLTRRNVQV